MVIDTQCHHAFKGGNQQGEIGSHTQVKGKLLTGQVQCVFVILVSQAPEQDIQHLGIRAREHVTHRGNGRCCLLVLALGEVQ